MGYLTLKQLPLYLDMLIQQSFTNEEKLGVKSDSVASKLDLIKSDILSNQQVVNRLLLKIDDIKSMHERNECDVLDGIDMGLVILTHLEDIIFGVKE